MNNLVRATVAGAVTVVIGFAAAGAASAQPAPPEPPLSPADQAAQYACLQKNLDFAALPQDALADPVAFSALVAQAAQECDAVRAPVAPAAPAG